MSHVSIRMWALWKGWGSLLEATCLQIDYLFPWSLNSNGRVGRWPTNPSSVRMCNSNSAATSLGWPQTLRFPPLLPSRLPTAPHFTLGGLPLPSLKGLSGINIWNSCIFFLTGVKFISFFLFNHQTPEIKTWKGASLTQSQCTSL